MLQPIKTGQRWISEMEPELGLGLVIKLEHRRAYIEFEAGECVRIYAIETAPIKRVEFTVGDTLKTRDDDEFTVEKVDDQDGLLIYSGNGFEIVESDLSPHISFTTPENRMSAGHVDPNGLFNLRWEALQTRYNILKSPVRGFVGGRIDLIPHQLYIAHEISERKIPRALLADEVGLGKTIEACLIMHRLLVSGRINRVLILVPEVLIYQWFVELLRRFNLMFRIIDEDFMMDLEEEHPDSNPFENEALVLCSSDFFEYEPDRFEQAMQAGWDLLIVDEAHHLKEGTHEYELVQGLSLQTPGLLLLTATPEQLGLHGHFERLRLLDPARYSDYDAFLKESETYHKVAELGHVILGDKKVPEKTIKEIEKIFSDDNSLIQVIQDALGGDDKSKKRLMGHMLDRHGIGRVMFRNTRSAMPDFPKREIHPVELKGKSDPVLLARLDNEFSGDTGRMKFKISYDFQDDPRIDWLAEFLKNNPDEKVLLICRTRRKAQAIHDALKKKIEIKSTLFHENMSIVQRDRNAAWFSEPDGARLLISSEIGSEGRNFQFSHHLVFVDLPVNPELLEQRIGRLDRIGQTSTIHIHVLFIPNTAYGMLFDWYRNGLNAFEKHVPGARQVYEEFKEPLWEMLGQANSSPDQKKYKQLIKDTHDFSEKLEQKLEEGRDRLLELHSFRPEAAASLVDLIESDGKNTSLDQLMHLIWEFYGINSDDIDIDKRTFRLTPGDLKIDAFPGFNPKGMIVSFDREKAIEREDIVFLSNDHPMVHGALDLVLGSEMGNSTIATLQNNHETGILLETIYVLECLAPLRLQVDRFLAPTPVRVMVEPGGKEKSDEFSENKMKKRLKTPVQAGQLLDSMPIKTELLPDLLKQSKHIAQEKAAQIIKSALEQTEQSLGDEIKRLKALKQVNDHVSDDEINLAEQEKQEIVASIKTARIRLDALRLIIIGDFSND